MTALTESPGVHRAYQANRREQLVAAASRFGQMELSDQRWTFEEGVLDRLLQEAVELSTSPRRAVWQTIVEDPATPLVVKLRTLAVVLQSFRA